MAAKDATAPTKDLRLFEKAREIPCPLCGSDTGEMCTRLTGESREKPHVDRRLAADE